MDLKIEVIETAKSKIVQHELMKADILPRHPSSVLFTGSSGSGKSNLCFNFLKNFLPNYFDEIYLISPTASLDDIQASVKIKATDTKLDPEFVNNIFNKQERDLKQKGVSGLKKVLILYDDVVSNTRYMNSKPFKRSFLMNRHYGCSTWLCSQSFKLVPRSMRIQANNLFIFSPNQSERDIILSEFTPPGKSKEQFDRLLSEVFNKPYNFLHINLRVPFEQRYRSGLQEILWFS